MPSPKAELLKLWLAKVCYEWMREMSDPELHAPALCWDVTKQQYDVPRRGLRRSLRSFKSRRELLTLAQVNPPFLKPSSLNEDLAFWSN